MIPALAGPRARFTFVVGKGGVGKSTAAAGLALAWSALARTHLVSTDPAHSIGDVFALQLTPGTASPACGSRLTVEEPDMRARADAWLQRVRVPLTELLERGSYLDGATIERFTALPFPGVDEIMGVLRLVELARADHEAVVVDTAPTGHTLRLLDAHRVLASWQEVLDALAAKADVVASAMVGRRLRSVGADLRAELERELAVFRADVLAAGDFVVVSRAGELVAAETARLRAALGARGLRERALLFVGAGAPADAIAVPWQLPAPRGCEGLRAWAAGLGTPAAAVIEPEAEAGAGDGVAWIRGAAPRLLIVAGKGGVGKTTCAAAAALVLADERRVLLMSVDPAGSLGDVLETGVDAVPRAVTDRLTVVQLDAAAAIERWRAQLLTGAEPLIERLGLGGEPALDRRVLESLWELAPPGMDELVALVELMDAADREQTVVLDTAPTGHLLRLLALPEVAQEWTRTAMRMLLDYGAAGELDGLTHGVIAFSKQLKEFRARLADAGWTGALVVTMQEPVVEAETARLVTSLATAGIPIAAILTNRHAGPHVPDPAASVTRLRAPRLTTAPRGLSGLRHFAEQWERY